MKTNLNKLYNKLHNKKVLITGGLGMIGSTIANKLVQLGADVTVVDACISPFGANYFNVKDVKDKININISDIRDRESIKCLIRNKDIVFNLAGQVSHNDSIDNPYLDAEINYMGHLNVLEALRHYSPQARILFAGSRLQYGKIEKNPVAEDHPSRPLTPYALNKLAAENLYLFYNRVYKISTVVFRIANPYGPRAQMRHCKYAMVNWFIRLAMENKTIKIFGDGNQIRDYIYVEDLAEAFILASVKKEANGQIFNVGSGVGTIFKDMAHLITDIVKSGKIDLVPWPENYINVETGDYIADISKIKNELDWTPKTRLKLGIEMTCQFYRKYKKYYWD